MVYQKEKGVSYNADVDVMGVKYQWDEQKTCRVRMIMMEC
jgi:hypothetical protein